METVNGDVYDNIRLREQIVVPDEIKEVMARFDSLYSSSYNEGVTSRCIALVHESANEAARYMADYGLYNLGEYVLAPGNFKNIQYFLDVDSGSPDLEVSMDISEEEEEDFGYGEMNHIEVDQEAILVIALENEVRVEEEVNPLAIVPYIAPSALVPVIDKGKKEFMKIMLSTITVFLIKGQ
ncbi:hypothetical protein AgCh_029545 [Apium graveolens]